MSGKRGVPILFWSILLSGWAIMRYITYPGFYDGAVAGVSPNPVVLRVTAASILDKPYASLRYGFSNISKPENTLQSKEFSAAALSQNIRPPRILLSDRVPITTQNLPAAVLPPFAAALVQNPRAQIQLAPYVPAKSKRLEIYSYSFIRPGAGQVGGISAAPQYGGGQSGIVAAYRISPVSWPDIAVLGRAALAHNGSRPWEFAAGLRVKPLRNLPVSLSAERRFRVGSTDVTAIYGASSIESAALPARFSARGYAQAGIVLGAQNDRFYDAGIRIDRPIISASGARLHLGVGSWAGGAARRRSPRHWTCVSRRIKDCKNTCYDNR